MWAMVLVRTQLRWCLAVIVLNDAAVWCDFRGDARVLGIDCCHEGFPDLVAGQIGILVFIFQPVADWNLPSLLNTRVM